jgi:asparagine synthase (glutamine-hydrolysing)
VEKFNQKNIHTLIQNILTLRYDPLQDTHLPVLDSHDFTSSKKLDLTFIENTLKNSIQTKLESAKNLTIFMPFFDNSLSPLNQVFLADYNGKLLYNFSIIGNKINQFFNLKPVAPILDPKLISYASHLSPESKYNLNKNKGKLPLRSLLSKHQCDSLVSKEKLGFSVNTINLWNSIGKELCELYLDNARIVEDGWINKEWISSNISKPNLDVRYVNKFLGLLSLEIWYRLFITKEMNAKTKLL